MGWSVGYDTRWRRDIGYGVPAICDSPGCAKVIDRGLSYVCGNDPFGGEYGCGLYFCTEHLYYAPVYKGRVISWDRFYADDEDADDSLISDQVDVCSRCYVGLEPFFPTADTEEWTNHKMTDPSWAQWRKENGY